MVKDKRNSHGSPCLGVYRSAQKCTLARDKSGNAVVLNRVCDKCNEQRCRAHCKCKRTGAARGKRAARGVTSISQATSPPAVVGLVGRAPAPSSLLLEDVAHMMRLCDKELDKAVEVEMASYQYDNLKLHRRLVGRLKDKSIFSLTVYIDAEQFAGRVPKLQRTRLAELKAAGKGKCKVYLCKGKCGKMLFLLWKQLA